MILSLHVLCSALLRSVVRTRGEPSKRVTKACSTVTDSYFESLPSRSGESCNHSRRHHHDEYGCGYGGGGGRGQHALLRVGDQGITIEQVSMVER